MDMRHLEVNPADGMAGADDNVEQAFFAGWPWSWCPLVLLGLSDRWMKRPFGRSGNDPHAFRSGCLGLPPDATAGYGRTRPRD